MARAIYATINVSRSDTKGEKADVIRKGLLEVLTKLGAAPLYNEPTNSDREGTWRDTLEWSKDGLPKGGANLKISFPNRISSFMDVRVWVDLLGDSKIWGLRSRISSEIKGYLSGIRMQIETDEFVVPEGHIPVKE